jgi:hypothetical protein
MPVVYTICCLCKCHLNVNIYEVECLQRNDGGRSSSSSGVVTSINDLFRPHDCIRLVV